MSKKKKNSSFICSSLPLYKVVVPQIVNLQYSFSLFFVLSVSYTKFFSMVKHFPVKIGKPLNKIYILLSQLHIF